MKLLKSILLIVVGLVVVFLLMGLIKSSVSYGHEISVSKSVEEAWAVTQDESKYAQWLKGFKSIELLSGEDGEVGSTYKVIVNPGEGQEDFEMIETVAALEEFDHVELHFDSEMMNFEQVISFTETDEGATVKTDSKVMGKGIMMKAMFAWMEMLGSSFTAQETENLEALKTLIEENTTDYYPAPVVEEEEVMDEGASEE